MWSKLTTGCITAEHGWLTVFTRWRQCPPPPNTCFLGSIRVQIPKRHLDQFSRFCTAHGRVAILYTGRPISPLKFSLPAGDLHLHLIHGSLGQWAQLSPQTKWHLDRLSCFCRAPYCDRLTDTPCYSVCNAA